MGIYPESHFVKRKLAPLFEAVQVALQQNRLDLNQADSINGNHGDNMVAVFQVATQAAEAVQDEGLAQAMLFSALALEALTQNGSAQVYASGLRQMGAQMMRREVTLDELITTVQGASKRKGMTEEETQDIQTSRSGEVLKALLSGLAGWNQVEAGKTVSENPLDIGAMFEFGMAYLQANQRNSERIDVLADAASSASPLSKIPHRHRSGVIAIRALLQAMQSP